MAKAFPCPHCKKEVPQYAVRCPHCQKNPTHRATMGCAVAFGVFVGAIILIILISGAPLPYFAVSLLLVGASIAYAFHKGFKAKVQSIAIPGVQLNPEAVMKYTFGVSVFVLLIASLALYGQVERGKTEAQERLNAQESARIQAAARQNEIAAHQEQFAQAIQAGDSAFQKKDMATAFEQYQEAKTHGQLDEGHVKSLLIAAGSRAKHFEASGKTAEAQAAYAEVLAHDPENAPAQAFQRKMEAEQERARIAASIVFDAPALMNQVPSRFEQRLGKPVLSEDVPDGLRLTYQKPPYKYEAYFRKGRAYWVVVGQAAEEDADKALPKFEKGAAMLKALNLKPVEPDAGFGEARWEGIQGLDRIVASLDGDENPTSIALHLPDEPVEEVEYSPPPASSSRTRHTKNCVKGKPCGGTCIPKWKDCHQ